jgi:hypothetical protein
LGARAATPKVWPFHPALAPSVIERDPGKPSGCVARILARRQAARLLRGAREPNAVAREEAQERALLEYQLPPGIQARALLCAPSTPMECAFGRLFDALEMGETVDVVAIGGSVTAGLTYGLTRGNWTYHHKVAAWLRRSWPRVNLTVHNLAVAGACAADLEPCLGDAGRLPARTRLVLLESAANLFSVVSPTASAQASAAADLERLVRKLLLVGVALIELATPMFWADLKAQPAAGERVPLDRASKEWPSALDTPGHDALTRYEVQLELGAAAPEAEIARVCCHYGVPAALQRAAYPDSLGIGSDTVATLVAARCGAGALPRGDTRPKTMALTTTAAVIRGSSGGGGAQQPLWPPPPTSPDGTLSLVALMRDRIHPSELGHAHPAQLIVRALQRALGKHLLLRARSGGSSGGVASGAQLDTAAASACATHGLQPNGRPGAPLPPPLFAANFATRATCARVDGLLALARAHPPPRELGAHGYDWVVETDHSNSNPKPGFVSTAVGSLLALPFIRPQSAAGADDEAESSQTAAHGLGGPGAGITAAPAAGVPGGAARAPGGASAPFAVGKAMIGLLKSWAGGMGVAQLECRGGCVCASCAPLRDCTLDGHIRRGRKRVSVTQQLEVFLKPRRGRHAGEPCWLAIRTLNRTSSGGHKVKVVSIMTRGVRGTVGTV